MDYVFGKTWDRFYEDMQCPDAVVRRIEIIGEAARKVSEPFKANHPDIPWREMVAQRNVLVHEYESIGDDEIWDVATVHVPELIQALTPLIPPLPPAVES